jgi:hypothetical protein
VLCLLAGSLLPDSAKIVLRTKADIMTVDGKASSVTIPFNHRLYHALSFGSTAFLLLLIARNTKKRFYGALGVIALGLAIEYIQHRLFGQPVEWWDVRDDGYGVLAAYVLGQWSALRNVLAKE